MICNPDPANSSKIIRNFEIIRAFSTKKDYTLHTYDSLDMIKWFIINYYEI